MLTAIVVVYSRPSRITENSEYFDENDILGRYGRSRDHQMGLRDHQMGSRDHQMESRDHQMVSTDVWSEAAGLTERQWQTKSSLPDISNPFSDEVEVVSGQAIGGRNVEGSSSYFLVGCAKVTWSEIPYLLEWLEYHRLQGFDKMVLYIDDIPWVDIMGIKNEYHLIEDYYRNELKHGDFLEVKTSGGLAFDSTADILRLRLRDYSPNSVYMHRLNQQTLVQHCWRKFRTRTEWFAHIDVDEFLYVDIANVTLRQYLRNFYVGGTHYRRVKTREEKNNNTENEFLAAVQEQEKAVSELYLLSSLSGLYIPTLNFGLGGLEHTFSPAFKVARNLLTGNIEFFASNTKVVPNLPTAEQPITEQPITEQPITEQPITEQPITEQPSKKSDSNQGPGKAIRDLTEYLQGKCHRPSYEAFSELLSNATRHHVSELPLVSNTCQRTVPNSRFGTSPAEILEIQSRMRPDCRPLLEVFNNTKGFAVIRTRNLPGMRRFAGTTLDRKFPVSCYPSALSSRLTTMGKTILWTGRRHQPPKGFRELPPSPLYPFSQLVNGAKGKDEPKESEAMQVVMANVPFPSVARRAPMNLNRFNLANKERMALDRIVWEDGSLAAGEKNEKAGYWWSVLPDNLSYRAYAGGALGRLGGAWLSAVPLWSRFGWRKEEVRLLAERNVPSWFCEVAWVHGCAHRVKYPLIISPAALRVNHYMIRSLEARTISDVSWRRGQTGWGKFGSNPVEFTVLEYATAVAATNASLVPTRLSQALANRYNVHFQPVDLRCTKAGVQRTWHTPCERTCPAHHPQPRFNGTACSTNSHSPDLVLCAVHGLLTHSEESQRTLRRSDSPVPDFGRHLGLCCT
ncbi:glycosyltransferase family 92 protein [Gregarina niphandrodes]|uniref:Glycosyltransferase family 92 protein n=1 Tax=Gregarina niphandrodes TaxID=110365 RepID=A0A023BAH2_GRENI|nr:glycosyltransferase family 92 protein [Gregarina niphandrodes]EZG78300.1 glycosyltransferase family 92 protein [Gregarina niphandrodes]|eukprot:XP_011129356.1 glycosyltransferase family 92 protein [Gregarina niphandrodes]